MDNFNCKRDGGFGEEAESEEEMDGEEDVKPEIKEEEEDEFEDGESLDGENQEEEIEFKEEEVLPSPVNDSRNPVTIGLPLPLPISFIQPLLGLSVPVQIRPNLPPPPLPVFIEPRTVTESRYCLLCYNRCTNDNFQRASTSIPIVLESPMEADFRVMFVLKKMLKISNEHLAQYLKQFGGNRGIPPRNWITFCNFCQPTINNALAIQKKIAKLEEKLKCFQTEMTERIKRSQKSRKKEPAQSFQDVIRVTNEVRSFVVSGKFRPFLLNPEVPHEFSPQPVNQEVPVVKLKPRRKRLKRRGRSQGQKETLKRTHEAIRKRKLAEKLSTNNEVPVTIPPSSPPPLEPSSASSPLEQSSPPSPLEPTSSLPPSSPSGSDMDFDVTVTLDDDDDDDDTPVQEQSVREEIKSVIAAEKTTDLVALTEGSYRCLLCPHINFEMNFNLFCSHLLFHYRRPYKCFECNTHFASDSALELDNCPINVVRKQSDSGGHLCSSSSLTHVETTLEFQNLLIWGCGYCDEKFSCHKERDLHERNCSKKEANSPVKKLRNQCKLCQKMFRNIVEWRFHMILEHFEVAKLGCNYCEESFSVKTKEGIDLLDDEQLKEHQLQCHRFINSSNMVQTGVQICDFCGEPFWSPNTKLHRHMETFHKIPKNNAFSCEICHYRTKIKSRLRDHLQINHYLKRKKILICEICGYENTREPHFDHHKFKEHGIVPLSRPLHSCSEEGCDFKTVMSNFLKQHNMSKHNAVRPHKCETCGKEFLSSTKLKCHQEIHLNKNLKPFQCEICGNSFAVKNYLYIHMRLSHQNRPFASTHKKKSPRRKNAAKPIKESTTDVNALSMDADIKIDQVEAGSKEELIP